MGYDLETINQAWYIACEECMENKPNDISDADMLTYIADYCSIYASELVREAAKELNERSVQSLLPLNRP